MDAFMDEFMNAMNEVFPPLLIQFEDFSTDNAFKYLDLFRERYRCFNDDVCIRMLFIGRVPGIETAMPDPRDRRRGSVGLSKRCPSRIRGLWEAPR